MSLLAALGVSMASRAVPSARAYGWRSAAKSLQVALRPFNSAIFAHGKRYGVLYTVRLLLSGPPGKDYVAASHLQNLWSVCGLLPLAMRGSPLFHGM